MYKLLVVDDERIIADLLAELFQHRKEFDLDVYKAYSGREALDILERYKVDIILTDITMPGMTGIELQAEVVKLWPRCRFIFLTAHGQFDYIQSAIRNQAVDFILKSENDEVLLRSVQKAIEAIEKESLAENFFSRVESVYTVALPVLQQMLFEDIFDGDIEESQIPKLFEAYKIDLNYQEPVLLLVGRADRCESKKLRRYVCVVSKLSQEILGCKVFAFFYEERYIVWLMQPPDGNGEQEALRLAQGNIDSMQQVCKSIFGVSVSVILDSHFVQWEQAVGSFITLSKKLDRFLGLSHEMAIQESDAFPVMGNSKNRPSDYMLSHILKRIGYLRLFLESAQQEEFYGGFDALTLELLNCIEPMGSATKMDKQISREAMIEILLQLNLMFFSVIRQKDIADDIEIFYPLDELTRIDTVPGAKSDLENRLSDYRRLADRIFQKHDRQKLSNMNVIFGQLRHYIHENISGDLSLNTLSQIVHFNPYYLSRLFKAVIDKSISEYINEVRLHRACELLRETDMLVSEISMAVGYENQQNFNRFFKRHINMSPLEYRDTSKTSAQKVKKR